MDEQPISPETRVAEALRLAPTAAKVFIRHRTACVGCSLARFCSLRDVAATYGLELPQLVDELERVCHAQEYLSERSSE